MKRRHSRTARLSEIVERYSLTHSRLAFLLDISEANARALTCGARVPSKRMLRLLELELEAAEPKMRSIT